MIRVSALNNQDYASGFWEHGTWSEMMVPLLICMHCYIEVRQ